MEHSVSVTRIKGFFSTQNMRKFYFLIHNQWPVSSETRS